MTVLLATTDNNVDDDYAAAVAAAAAAAADDDDDEMMLLLCRGQSNAFKFKHFFQLLTEISVVELSKIRHFFFEMLHSVQKGG